MIDKDYEKIFALKPIEKDNSQRYNRNFKDKTVKAVKKILGKNKKERQKKNES
jgi:hypothetical protein